MIRFSTYEEQVFETYFSILDYFRDHPDTIKFPARDLMPYLQKKKIFHETLKERSPVEELLDVMDEKGHINVFSWALGEGDRDNLQWFFIFLRGRSLKDLEEKIDAEQDSEYTELGDENYLIDLCDDILDQKGIRQYIFDSPGIDENFPVHAFYPALNLAVFYKKLPQSEVCTRLENINWKSDRSVHEEKEEERFLEKLRELLPEKGIQLVEIPHFHFSYNKLKRMQKNRTKDVLVLERLWRDLL